MGSASEPDIGPWRFVSEPVHAVWRLYRVPYRRYGICIGFHTGRMGSASGPIQAVWDLYRIPHW
eukprot:611374-Pyramimonas_sp.AAC.1